ncbi:potassium channel family protein [Stenotrophomonas sp. CFBP 13718]|uniref:potassium channel family protein n=1 Tax=Stenotrophomonas sp. CFBP 13718 TaxID=2775304 RepID=UPI00177B8C69|nr:potassium channel family protein [Stenotrophomonas sp. CFBP 13718]MBD8697465.1 two pore domain potassium channel family protein [Stenotrophomonas sp. CFBP 13718]
MQADKQSSRERLRSLKETLVRLWPMFKVGFVFPLAVVPLLLAKHPSVAVGLGILVILAGYALFARLMNRSLVLKKEDLIAVIAVFFLFTLELIFLYAVYYRNIALAGTPSGIAAPLPSITDAFYFSTATFTSLGFGDIVPLSPAGKWMVTSQALLGMTHAVLFVVVFLRNLDFSAAHGSAR